MLNSSNRDRTVASQVKDLDSIAGPATYDIYKTKNFENIPLE